VSCTGRYAEAWQFASFLCVEALIVGADNSGGAGNASLTDTQVHDFRSLGVEANKGMILYNATQDTSGSVAAVTAQTITATGVAWNDGDAYRIVAIDARQRAAIEANLNIAAGDIHVARAASGGCDCTLSVQGRQFAAHVNIINAAAFYSCSCGAPAAQALKADTRRNWQRWVQQQLDMIRDGRLELCEGETGADFPAVGWADQGVTEFAQARIILDDILRDA